MEMQCTENGEIKCCKKTKKIQQTKSWEKLCLSKLCSPSERRSLRWEKLQDESWWHKPVLAFVVSKLEKCCPVQTKTVFYQRSIGQPAKVQSVNFECRICHIVTSVLIRKMWYGSNMSQEHLFEIPFYMFNCSWLTWHYFKWQFLQSQLSQLYFPIIWSFGVIILIDTHTGCQSKAF